MKLEIFGTGCANCKRLRQVTERAARELGLDVELEKVEELDAILSAGVVRTPALAVDGDLVVSGRVPSLTEVRGLLEERAGVV